MRLCLRNRRKKWEKSIVHGKNHNTNYVCELETAIRDFLFFFDLYISLLLLKEIFLLIV